MESEFQNSHPEKLAYRAPTLKDLTYTNSLKGSRVWACFRALRDWISDRI